MGEKRGMCRAVLHKADVRILGTNSVLQAVNIEEFSHLKVRVGRSDTISSSKLDYFHFHKYFLFIYFLFYF